MNKPICTIYHDIIIIIIINFVYRCLSQHSRTPHNKMTNKENETNKKTIYKRLKLNLEYRYE